MKLFVSKVLVIGIIIETLIQISYELPVTSQVISTSGQNTVISVGDGDTIRVGYNNQRITVRLA